MVVCSSEHGLQAEIIFVIEGTAVNGAYINDIKTNYIMPSLEWVFIPVICLLNWINMMTFERIIEFGLRYWLVQCNLAEYWEQIHNWYRVQLKQFIQVIQRSQFNMICFRYFSQGNLDDNNYLEDSTSVYGIVVYQAADCLPHPSTDTFGPFTSAAKVYSAIERLE